MCVCVLIYVCVNGAAIYMCVCVCVHACLLCCIYIQYVFACQCDYCADVLICGSVCVCVCVSVCVVCVSVCVSVCVCVCACVLYLIHHILGRGTKRVPSDFGPSRLNSKNLSMTPETRAHTHTNTHTQTHTHTHTQNHFIYLISHSSI